MKLEDARQMALAELIKHDLDKSGWTFGFNNAKMRFGVCRYRTKRIELSAPLTELNDEVRVLSTILHEVAHAIAGGHAGHGHRWKRVCREIGAKPERCYDMDSTVMPASRYAFICGNCGYSSPRHKRLAKPRRVACRSCCNKYNFGRFNEKYELVFTELDNESNTSDVRGEGG